MRKFIVVTYRYTILDILLLKNGKGANFRLNNMIIINLNNYNLDDYFKLANFMN